MTDKVVLTIDLTPEDRQRIEELAQKRGYNAASDYLLALVEADELLANDDDEIDIRAELKEGLRQALEGETVPLESLWEDDDELTPCSC